METRGKNRGGKRNQIVPALAFFVLSVLQNGCGTMVGGPGRATGGLGNDVTRTASVQRLTGSPLAGEFRTDLAQAVVADENGGGIQGNFTKAEPGNPQGGGSEKGGDGDTIGTPSTKHPAGNRA